VYIKKIYLFLYYMFPIPFIDREGLPQTYGNEFDQMYRLELNQNLQSPLEEGVDYNTGSKYTLYDTTDGIYNQAKLYENNDDPQEDQQVTDQQALARIRNTAGTNRPLTESEMRFNLYTDDNFDIRFRNKLVSESMKANDNIFSEFSQDHVNAIRASNTSQNREENLYDVPETLASRTLSAIQNITPSMTGRSMTSEALGGLMNLAREEQKRDAQAQAFRDRQMPKPVPTMNQKFDIRMSGRPTMNPVPAPRERPSRMRDEL